MSKPVILLDQGQLVGLSGTADGQVLQWNDSTKEWEPATGGGTGTVTSVDVSGGTTGLTTSGGPIIGAGTITLDGTLVPENGGTGLNAPAAGDVGKVLTAKDDGTYELATPAPGGVTSVTASAPLASSGGATPDISLTGVIDVANGGTGLSTVTTAGSLLYVSDPDVISEGTLSNLDWSQVIAPGAVDLTTAPSEAMYLYAGSGANLGVDSGGDVDISGGNGSSGGIVYVYGGNSYGPDETSGGNVELSGGFVDTTGNAASLPGSVVIQSGTQFVSGATAKAGDVLIDTGTSDAGGGTINIGTTNADSVSIGRFGHTTAIGGSLTLGSLLASTYGGTGLGAPSAADAGKVLAVKAGGSLYELVPQSGGGGGGTVTNIATGTGLTGGPITTTGTISLATVGTEASNQGSATKTVTVSTDAYGRVTALSEQSISGLAASVISSGQIATAQGGTGIDASGVTNGELLVGQTTGSFALHAMSQDATMANDGKVTVQGLQTRAVSSAAPSAGQTLVWSASGNGAWVPGSQASGGSGGGGVLYYMNAGTAVPATNGIPAGTYQLGRTAEGGSHPISLANVPTSWTRIAAFVSDAGDPSLTSIPAGIWDFNVWASSTAIANGMFFRLTFYAYDGSTNPESGPALGTSVTSYIYDPSQDTQYTTSFALAQTAFTGKRIYIKLEAQASVASTNVTFGFGDGEASHVHTTVPSVTGSGFVKVLNDVIVGTGQTVDLSSSTDVGSSVLGVANGGTGLSSLTNHGLVIGQGTAAVASLVGTADGDFVRWNGADWTSAALSSNAVTSLTGTTNQVNVSGSVGAVTLSLPQDIASTSSPTFAGLTLTTALTIANGGTNNGSLSVAAGTVYYGDGSKLVGLPPGTSGQFLKSNGAAAPSWDSSSSPAANYDLRGSFIGTPASSLIIDHFVADRAFVISTTATNHKFSALNKTSSATVTLTLQRTRTTGGTPSTVTILQAVSDSTDTILNGYYPMTVGTVSNNSIEANDVLELVVQAGAVNSQFTTPMWTIYGTAS
jgi:hypothetical protein